LGSSGRAVVLVNDAAEQLFRRMAASRLITTVGSCSGRSGLFEPFGRRSCSCSG
jgi:hypothetical protein